VRRDSISLGSAAPSRVVVADQSLVCCVGRGDLSLYIWTRACPPLFACLFRLDVIRRKETNSDLISITFCDDAAHFFTPSCPLLACVVDIYSKEKRWPSLQFPYWTSANERTREEAATLLLTRLADSLCVCVEKTETSYSAGIYLYVPWRLAPLLSTVLYSPFVLF
jgi:hypothetical protein